MNETKFVELIQLTKKKDHSSLIMTPHGEIPFLKWLILEKARIETNPFRKAEIIFGTKGHLKNRVALYVNSPKDCTCEYCKPFA